VGTITKISFSDSDSSASHLNFQQKVEISTQERLVENQPSELSDKNMLARLVVGDLIKHLVSHHAVNRCRCHKLMMLSCQSDDHWCGYTLNDGYFTPNTSKINNHRFRVSSLALGALSSPLARAIHINVPSSSNSNLPQPISSFF
jgi:hypothetical protein